ncbi:hypothetical protein [Devosia sp.]|nr:hypothetical protein [Devosia sp.]
MPASSLLGARKKGRTLFAYLRIVLRSDPDAPVEGTEAIAGPG